MTISPLLSKLRAPACALLFCLSGPALAVQATYPSVGDARVRTVEYNPHNIVPILTRYGVATLIMLDSAEEIVDMNGGDTEAWGVASNKAKNGFFLKPAALLPNTNMHVITKSGNVYNFDLRLAGKNKPYYVTVWFRYPKSDANKKTAATEESRVRNLLVKGDPVKNRRYSVEGASSILPIDVWNDRIGTHFRFAANSTIPAVYAVGEDGLEKLVNFTGTPDDVLSIAAISPKFVLRLGDKLVACVYNDAYDSIGVRPATNTASPAVERILKDAQP